MKYELFDYQEAAVAALSKQLIRATRDYDEDPDERTAVVLAAPTGAGKTVIATGVIEASVDGDEANPGVEDATFLWVTDDPSLNRQTLQKMLDSSSDIKLNRLVIVESDFDEEAFAPGRVYFLNIQNPERQRHVIEVTDRRTHVLALGDDREHDPPAPARLRRRRR